MARRTRGKPRIPSHRVRRQKSVKTPVRALVLMTRVYEDQVRQVHAAALSALDAYVQKYAKKDSRSDERAKAELAAEASFILDRLRARFEDPEVSGVVASVARTIRGSVEKDLQRIARVSPAQFVGGLSGLQQFQARNVELIETVGLEHLDRLKTFFQETEIRTLNVQDVATQLEDLFEVDRNRAEFWAVDQSLKLHADITETRARAVGLGRYVWTTSNDERVRDTHAELDGEVFEFDSPPVVNEAGDRHNPGGDYRCRCTPFLLLDDEFEAADVDFGG